MFIDGDTGAPLGTARLARDQLPAGFDANTTVTIGTTTWLVDRAEPSTPVDVARKPVLTATVPSDLIRALGQAMELFDLVLVNWCGCSVIDPVALAGYLAS